MEWNRMLEGYTVGITADRRWQEQADLFERRGAAVVHGASIRTLLLRSDGQLRAAIDEVIGHPPDVVIANTGIGVRTWVSAADSFGLAEKLRESLAGAKIFARGPKASTALRNAGLEAAGKAKTERLSEAVDMAIEALEPGRMRVAVQVDGSGKSPDLDRLRDAGADVVLVPVYQWTLPEDVEPALQLARETIAGRIDAVTFTAAPAVNNWLAIAEADGLDEKLLAALNNGGVVVGCVGPVCGDAARKAGIDDGVIVEPAAARIAPLVRAVADALVSRQQVDTS